MKNLSILVREEFATNAIPAPDVLMHSFKNAKVLFSNQVPAQITASVPDSLFTKAVEILSIWYDVEEV